MIEKTLYVKVNSIRITLCIFIVLSVFNLIATIILTKNFKINYTIICSIVYSTLIIIPLILIIFSDLNRIVMSNNDNNNFLIQNLSNSEISFI